MDHLHSYMADLRSALDALDLSLVAKARDMMADARREGKQIFLCGNGGSAATASHMANDLGKGASYGRASEARFRVTALTDNVPWMTALANDVDYESVFSEQLCNLGQEGDLLIAISGSGNSQNVLNAVAKAKEKEMKTIGWTGFDGGRLACDVDLAIVAKSNHMGRVEDIHTVLMHLTCYYFMETDERPCFRQSTEKYPT